MRLYTHESGERMARANLEGFDVAGWTDRGDIPEGVDPAWAAWDGAAIVEDMAALRALRWADVKRLRDAHENGGCMSPLGRVDTDPLSIGRITAAVVLAQASLMVEAPYAQDWTMEDNSVVVHDAAAMIAMGVAVGAHVGAVHTAGRILRDAIDAAETRAALDEIDVSGGWPT